MRALSKMRLLLTCLFLASSLALGVCAEPSAKDREDLRSSYQGGLSRIQRGRERCLKSKRELEALDLFAGSSGSRVIGLDVFGRVWFLKNTGQGSCELTSAFRLERPDYELNEYGDRVWRLYHYEGVQVCLYSRLASESSVKRSCYDPLGIVSKYAPYMVH